MKKLLLSVSVLFAVTANSQDCSELFISEYIEGPGNNNAIEIYNPTNNQYKIQRKNGSTAIDVITIQRENGNIIFSEISNPDNANLLYLDSNKILKSFPLIDYVSQLFSNLRVFYPLKFLS